MTSDQVEAFFAYPSAQPSLEEAIEEAARQLTEGGQVSVKPWTESRVGGKVIIEEICRDIENADLFMADLTNLNANVMFELGYAISQNKRVWLVLDTTYQEQKKLFDQFRILTTIGYAACTNSSDIVKAFYRDKVVEDLETTIFKSQIEASVDFAEEGRLLYLKSRHQNEAAINISRRIDHGRYSTTVDDPQESTVQSLAWYGAQVCTCAGMICHLINPDREGARLHTARYALVAGMAFGFKKPLLILAEGAFLAPVDYRDLLKHYSSATEALTHLEAWITTIEDQYFQRTETGVTQRSHVQLATELKNLRLGHYVAENESSEALTQHFVVTSAYEDAINERQTVFVGRKGAGKTANLIKLAHDFSADSRAVVCVVKPVAYEMQGIAKLLDRSQYEDAKGYTVESLWKFLLTTEIAVGVKKKLEKFTALDRSSETDPRVKFLNFVDLHSDIICPDFAIRLERCVRHLLETAKVSDGSRIDDTRLAISETLHRGILHDLRQVLVEYFLRGRKRDQVEGNVESSQSVFILIDNLDKAWDSRADLTALSEILLGLLEAAKRLPQDFEDIVTSGSNLRVKLPVRLCIFLRSDIFHRVKQAAREPDKVDASRIRWNDPELLLRVIDERFLAARTEGEDVRALWARFFCSRVRGRDIRKYLTYVVLPRPRDLIYLVNAAVAVAVNRRHGLVEEKDFREAEKQYSQFALESVVVENTVADVDLEGLLFEFAGSSAVITEEDLSSHMDQIGIRADRDEEIVDLLCGATFLGQEVEPDSFVFSDDLLEHRRNKIRARHYGKQTGDWLRFRIHPAFHGFLEISD